MAKSTLIPTTPVEACCPSVFEGVVADDQAKDLAKGFAALSDPVRLKIVSILAAAEDGEVCACDFVGPTGKAQPTVSHHLKVLAEAGLVTGDKRGRWVWYALVPDRIDALRSALAPS